MRAYFILLSFLGAMALAAPTSLENAANVKPDEGAGKDDVFVADGF
ncbi:hypothetical protein N7471_006686 [Penicillium samsonianum]|nr:uncharacterized protein N7471_006686 [Penicillium samsonianum]KAJ6140200.1 hypothetical protein N7471_006686 [Penicillium samsonianum]